MVAVVQLVEHQVVILGVAGSSPVSHPEVEHRLTCKRGWGDVCFPGVTRPAGTVVNVGDAVELRAVCLEGPRVRLRKARDGDAEGLIETQTDERVRRYLGGPRPVNDVRAVLESVGAATLLEGPGCYIATAADSDEMLGTVTLSRRRTDVPGHLDTGDDELELSYVFRPHAWGQGYASEATRLLLEYAAGELGDQPVVIVTQTANRASLRLAERLGFSVVGTFEQYDAEQALATAQLATFLPTEA